MGTAIIAHGDTPPVLEPSEHVFYFVALFVEFFIVFVLDFAVLLRRGAGRYSLFNQRDPEPVGVITAIRQSSTDAFGSLSASAAAPL